MCNKTNETFHEWIECVWDEKEHLKMMKSGTKDQQTIYVKRDLFAGFFFSFWKGIQVSVEIYSINLYRFQSFPSEKYQDKLLGHLCKTLFIYFLLSLYENVLFLPN